MPTEKNVFRKLDSDSSPLQQPNGAALDMLNVRVTETGCYNVKGNVPRFLGTMPTGLNKTIGQLEDKQGDTVIYFVFNSEGNHRIVQYWPDTLTSQIRLQWSGLDFQETDTIEAAIVDDLLFFATKGRGEIRQINITRTAQYDAIKATDPYFANLVKRQPVLPLVNNGRNLVSGGLPSLISDSSYQATYQYVYADNERSVFAPFSKTSLIPYASADRNKQQILFALPVGEVIPPLVKAINVAVRADNSGVLTVFQQLKPPFTAPIIFDNSTFIETVDDAVGTTLFDAIPLNVHTLTIARNRLEIANYTEGYDAFDSIELDITPNTYLQLPFGSLIWKSNTRYKVGILPKDYAGRTFGVITKPNWQFSTSPLYFKSGGNWDGFTEDVDLDVSGTVPDWVDSFEVVISQPSYSFFIDGFGYLVFYFGEFDNAPVYGQYGTNTAGTKAFINISSLSERGVGYSFEQGDFVNIHYNDRYAAGDATGSQTTYVKTVNNIPIKGMQGELLEIEMFPEWTNYNRFDAFFDAPTNFYSVSKGNFMDGVVFEIFRSNKNTGTFYGTGQAFKVAGNSISETVNLKGNVTLIQNSKVNDFRYEHLRYTDGSDTIELNLNPPTKESGAPLFFPFMEAMSPWDKHYSKWATNNGKPSIVVPDAKQVYKKNYERFSNKYLSGTLINGLNSFEALNEKDLPVENGAINKLILASNAQAEGTVLLAIMQNETESQYLGEMQWRDTQGNTTTAISEQVIGSTNTLRGGYGTINPESVAMNNGSVYFWDATKGEVVRYGADGLQPLSTICRMKSFFNNVAKLQQPYKDKVKVFGGYDARNEEYVMHFQEVRDEEGVAVLFAGFTIAYSEREKTFTSRYSYHPEGFAKSNTLFFTFKNGVIWQHEANETCNNFFGNQYKSSIRFISNQQPSQVKIWSAIAIEGQTVWVPKELKNEMGQATEMKAAWFKQKEGMFYGAMRRDNSGKTGDAAIIALNNGKPMRSAYLDITLENEETELTRLDAVNVIYIASSGHTTIN